MGNPIKDNNHIATTTIEGGPGIEITLYTDPLCIWSWAFEPQLDEIKKALAGKATWKLRMGGMIPSWNNFHDEVNSVSRPSQMGPVWMHAGQVSNRPVHHQIWLFDPPVSSYPACIAVKCAQLQSEELGILYLSLLREACMTNGKNIAKREVLEEAARNLALSVPDFDVKKFANDFDNDNGINAFRSDLELVKYYNINRFPTLIIKSSLQKSILISGYRHYEQVLEAIKQIEPDVTLSTANR